MKTNKTNKRSVFMASLFGAVLLLTSVFSPWLNNSASATPISEMNLVEKTRSYLYYDALLNSCFKAGNYHDGGGGQNNVISAANAASGDWFRSAHGYVDNYGFLADDGLNVSNGENARVYCNDLVRKAVGVWGYESPLHLLCDIRERGDGTTGEACVASQSGDGFGMNSDVQDAIKNAFSSAVINKFYNGNQPALTDAMKYLLYEAAFFAQNGCSARPLTDSLRSGTPDRFIYEVNYVEWREVNTTRYFVASTGQEVVNPQPSLVANAPEGYFRTETIITNAPRLNENSEFYGVDKSERRAVSVAVHRVDNVYAQQPCSEVAAGMTQYAQAYQTYLMSNQNEWEAIESINDPIAGEELPSSCAINGIGWIICPVLNFAAEIADWAFGILATSFLSTDVRIFDTTGDNQGTFIAWGVMRDFANIAFVIAFLFIIFSQATSFGISSYGIKKMLPRLIAAAILVNISFFIAQLAVDISNILGFSLYNFFESVANSANPNASAAFSQLGTSQTGDASWAGLVMTVVAAGGAYMALGALIPFLAAALIALLMIFLILTLREMLIILLIIISPLAFVAFLLPNTESLFKKWQKLFTSLLLLFPIIAVIFGASSLASSILRSIYTDSTFIGENSDTIGQIVAAGIMVIPLFLVPIVLKGALNNVGKLGATINGLGNKMSGSASKASKTAYDRSAVGRGRASRKQIKEGLNTEKYARRMSGTGVRSRLTRTTALGAAGLGMTPGLRTQKSRLLSSAQAASDKTYEEEIKNSESLLKREFARQQADSVAAGKKFDDKSFYKEALSSKDSTRRLAAQSMMFRQGGFAMEMFRDILEDPDNSNSFNPATRAEFQRNIANNFAGDTMKAAPDIAQWAFRPTEFASISAAAGEKSIWKASNEAIAGQLTAKAVKRAAQAGSISADRAQKLLADKYLSAQMDTEKIDTLRKIVSGEIRQADATAQDQSELVIQRDSQQTQDTSPPQNDNNQPPQPPPPGYM